MSLTPMSPSEFQNTLDTYLDFHRTYLFRVLFFDGLLGAVKGALVTNLISQTDTPTSITGAISLGWQAGKVKLTGKTDYPDWKVTIRDDALNIAHTYFQDWRNDIYNLKTGQSNKVDTSGLLATLGFGISGGYKRSAVILMLANTNRTTAGTAPGMIRGYLINGIWPKEVGTIALDYATENIATFPVTFSIDSFEPYSVASEVLSLATTLTPSIF